MATDIRDTNQTVLSINLSSLYTVTFFLIEYKGNGKEVLKVIFTLVPII